MTTVQTDPSPSRKELRQFGLVIGTVVGLVFGLLLPWLVGFAHPLWPWIVFGVLVLWALVWPASLRILWAPWMRMAHVLGKINTAILLAMLYFTMFTVMGLFARLFGHDPMARRRNAGSESYRVQSREPKQQNLKRPY